MNVPQTNNYTPCSKHPHPACKTVPVKVDLGILCSFRMCHVPSKSQIQANSQYQTTPLVGTTRVKHVTNLDSSRVRPNHKDVMLQMGMKVTYHTVSLSHPSLVPKFRCPKQIKIVQTKCPNLGVQILVSPLACTSSLSQDPHLALSPQTSPHVGFVGFVGISMARRHRTSTGPGEDQMPGKFRAAQIPNDLKTCSEHITF